MRRDVTELRLGRGSFGSVPSASPPPRPRVAWDGAALMAAMYERVLVHNLCWVNGEPQRAQSTAWMRCSREHIIYDYLI
jgi:hypothetical protein